MDPCISTVRSQPDDRLLLKIDEKETSMSRKMVGWIALVVFVVGGLGFGLNSALGSEPAPSGKKASHAQKASASTSTSKPTLGGAASLAQKLFDAVQSNNGGTNGNGSTTGPLNFISNLAKNRNNGK
jgi:hypothetical protein